MDNFFRNLVLLKRYYSLVMVQVLIVSHHSLIPYIKYGLQSHSIINGMLQNLMDQVNSNIIRDYKLVKKLGSGAFGEVFLGINIKNNSEVAVKLQAAQSKSPQLFYEAKILNSLANNDTTTDYGIPRVYYCGSEEDYNVMVMDLFGQSLQDIYINIGRKFDLKTTLMVGIQMIQRIQFIHSKGYLHRDIKPDNFVIGKGKKSNKVYIIDFGLSKRYLLKDGAHIPYRDNKNLTGTARYASLNTHLGIQQGRRDDIQGIMNVLLYFVKGALPWQNLKANGKKQKYEKIMDKKLSIPLDKLCVDLPEQFTQLFIYCRSLDFQQDPDYNYIKGLFKSMMHKQRFQMDYNYCWTKS